MALFQINGKDVELYHGASDGADAIQETATGSGGPRVMVKLQCAWADRYTVFAGMLGSASGSTTSISRIPPFLYPPSPNLACLGISNARGTKYKGDWNYEKCVFDAEFGVPAFDFPGWPGGTTDPSGVPYTTTTTRVSAEVIQIPIGGYKFTSGVDSGKAVPESQIGLTVPHSEITITRHMMPGVPYNEVMQYVGKVNSTTVRIGNRIYAIGELLFNGFDHKPTADGAASRTFELVYSILGVAGHTWNQVIDRDGQWITINTETDLSGEYPFESADWWNNLP
jgi:hypothetical protein